MDSVGVKNTDLRCHSLENQGCPMRVPALFRVVVVGKRVRP